MATAGIDTVDAGWRSFQIIWCEDIVSDGMVCHGLTEFDKGQIKLDISMSEELAIETVLHELSHVLLETHGLGGGSEDKELSVKNEDAVVQISRGLLQMIRLNPELFSIIFESIDSLGITKNEEIRPTTKKSRKS
jgi:hypothetical protein